MCAFLAVQKDIYELLGRFSLQTKGFLLKMYKILGSEVHLVWLYAVQDFTLRENSFFTAVAIVGIFSGFQV